MLASRPSELPSWLVAECISPEILNPYRSGLTATLNAAVRSSALAHGEDEIGRAVARPHRTLDGCRQPRISPVAGKKQVFLGCDRARPQGVLLRRRLECGTALAYDLPGRQFTMHAPGLADIPPDRLC